MAKILSFDEVPYISVLLPIMVFESHLKYLWLPPKLYTFVFFSTFFIALPFACTSVTHLKVVLPVMCGKGQEALVFLTLLCSYTGALCSKAPFLRWVTLALPV